MDIAVDIITAYVSHNPVAQEDLPGLIDAVFQQVRGTLEKNANEDHVRATPAVSIEDSVTDDYIICLEDGHKYKSLKRHLRAQYQMTPKQYREKWGLPSDYPMVAKTYSKERSRLAKRTGLGKKQSRDIN